MNIQGLTKFRIAPSLRQHVNSHTISKASTKDPSDYNMEHIKYLENIIMNLRNDVKRYKHQNRELKDENNMLRRQICVSKADSGIIPTYFKESSRS